jgi:hypothetical protein
MICAICGNEMAIIKPLWFSTCGHCFTYTIRASQGKIEVIAVPKNAIRNFKLSFDFDLYASKEPAK